mmetsp:Transcript_26195/g.74469  ORF Transcript_26195/g.74469 Transcript_26195/m.74469 type:complete len:247 (+) Transcript_26195:334-1074(+)
MRPLRLYGGRAPVLDVVQEGLLLRTQRHLLRGGRRSARESRRQIRLQRWAGRLGVPVGKQEEGVVLPAAGDTDLRRLRLPRRVGRRSMAREEGKMVLRIQAVRLPQPADDHKTHHLRLQLVRAELGDGVDLGPQDLVLSAARRCLRSVRLRAEGVQLDGAVVAEEDLVVLQTSWRRVPDDDTAAAAAERVRRARWGRPGLQVQPREGGDIVEPGQEGDLLYQGRPGLPSDGGLGRLAGGGGEPLAP